MQLFVWRSRYRPLLVAAVLAGLAIIPYLPFFSLPHISDDYLQIELGRKYGPISEWSDLARDALYRCRATSIVLTNWTENLVGTAPAVFQAQSTAVHAANTLLVAALGGWTIIGWRLAVLAAAFFAVHEGHQEAVVWYAAIPELLVFFFALLALHAWIWWLKGDQHRVWAYAATVAAFLLALLSKESAVAVVPLMAGAAYLERKPWSRIIKALTPFAVISVLYAAAIFGAKQTHLHLNDGTFSTSSPVVEVVARSSFRLLWIWGVVALGALVAWRPSGRKLMMGAAAWIVITLLPYSFLKYMPHVPSRHVYWASVGLAFLVAAALLKLWDRLPERREIAVALAAAIIAHNCGYLWIKKLPQYERRAAPTEKFLTYSEGVPGQIVVKCFPYGAELADLALQIRAGRPAGSAVWDPNAKSGDGVYCDEEKP
jgi:hypothetical protein